MRTKLTLAIGLALVCAPAYAQDVRISISGAVVPGVYGRVDIGGRPPPPLFFPQPVMIVKSRQGPPLTPIYMHVPPGHARNWSKHCSKYNACNHPVYFVKSAEYEPGYRHPGKGRGKGKDR
jgi:hypothetical protein